MKTLTAVFITGLVLLFSISVDAQTTAFNFQGRLNDGTSPANGRYDLQFKLFDAITGGAQVGSTADRPNLTLINGVFSTTLDYGASAFMGGVRFVEISVKPNGSPNAYVVLGARQQILSVPFSVRAANATQADNATTAQNAVTAQLAANASSLGGVPASNYAKLDFLNLGGVRFTGNVGLGTDTPNTRLTITGGAPWTASGWTASMNMENGSALGWEANTALERFGIGQTNDGLNFFRTQSAFGSTLNLARHDLRITNSGDIAQPVDRNGFVKAMVAITASGAIARCYNGVSGSSSGTCNIVVNSGFGAFIVDFPFQVTNRYWIVTSDGSSGQAGNLTASVTPHPTFNNRLTVVTRVDGSQEPLPFHLFVF